MSPLIAVLLLHQESEHTHVYNHNHGCIAIMLGGLFLSSAALSVAQRSVDDNPFAEIYPDCQTLIAKGPHLVGGSSYSTEYRVTQLVPAILNPTRLGSHVRRQFIPPPHELLVGKISP